MKSKLARILIERGVIQRGTMMEAYYNTKGISCLCDTEVLGTFRLVGAQATKDWVYFETIIPDTKEPYRLRCDQIISLDGMPMVRISEAQQLNEDGDETKKRKRADSA